MSTDGSVYAWGFNENGNLGLRQYNSRYPSAPRKIMFSGIAEFVPTEQLACGMGHTLTLDPNGRIWGWGRNFHGQVGSGTRQDHPFAARVKVGETDLPCSAIATGGYHSLALTVTGNVYAWGFNGNGELGQDTQDNFNTKPLRVSFPEGIKISKLCCGKRYSLALSTDGQLFAWGDNRHFQLGMTLNDPSNKTPRKVESFDNKIVDMLTEPTRSVSACTDATGKIYMWGKLPKFHGEDVTGRHIETVLSNIMDVFSCYQVPVTTPHALVAKHAAGSQVEHVNVRNLIMF